MFLATSCLFTMYVCRVILVMPDLQFMFTVPDIWRREAVTMGMAIGDGLLQEVWFRILSRMRAPPGRVRWTRPRLPKLDTGSGELAGKFQNHHQQWCVH